MRNPYWAILLLGGLVLVYACPPSQYGFYPLCPIKVLTGFSCPGCGSTRALHALLHLRFSEAFALNPLFTCASPVLSVWLTRIFLQSKGTHALSPRP